MREHSEAAWKIASLYRLASETRDDIAAQIDEALKAEWLKGYEAGKRSMVQSGSTRS
jgi:hypothetical protein